MRSGTHGAMLATGVEGSGGAVGGRQVRGGPLRQLQLGVRQGSQLIHAVAGLGQHLAFGIDQHGAERLIACPQGFGGQGQAVPQVGQIVRGKG